jgi:hypothetical protein
MADQSKAVHRPDPPINAKDFGVPAEFAERAENYARWAAAAERLKAELLNAELLTALKLVLPTLERLKFEYADCSYGGNFVQSRADTARRNHDVVRAAIAKAEGTNA